MKLELNWEYVADGVMGGVSRGALSRGLIEGHDAHVLRGDVSLDNNGGFIQIASDLNADGSRFDASGWSGLALELYGNGETYDVRLRTEQLSKPWQSFRTQVTALPAWKTVKLPFATFEAHKTDAEFDAACLRRIGILAIGREFSAMIAIDRAGLYRD